MSQLASPVEIYWISGSPFAWRVLLTAEVKGIPYEGKLLDASKGELKTRSSSPSILLAAFPRSATAISRSMNPLQSWSILIASTPIHRFSGALPRRPAGFFSASPSSSLISGRLANA